MEKCLETVLNWINGMSISIDKPYINFSFVKATPALVLCVSYFIILVIVCCYEVTRGKIRLHILSRNTYSAGRKRHITQSVIGLLIGSIVCWMIPFFFEPESLIIKIFQEYLRYEPIIAIGIFLFFCFALFTKENKDKHIAAANKVVQFVLPISIGTGLFERRIDLGFGLNWVVLVFLYMFYFLLLVTDCEVIEEKDVSETQCNDISHNPVEKIEQLFPQHKAQAENIAAIIADSSSEPFSICLSGKWGTGKTSVINGVTEILREKDRDNYAFIRINAMELDDKKTLLNYFMSEMKLCLKERGVYVGLASEYRDFLASMLGTVTTESFGTLVQKKIFGGEKDYREQKKHLENILGSAFGKGKLVLIVDDIERCDSDMAKEYLFLIKEVATMKNCVSVFVTDYEILLELFETDRSTHTTTSNVNNDFLDKFFNYKVDLYDETPEEIMSFYDSSFKDDGGSVFKSIYELVGMAPGTWYKRTLEEIDSRIVKQEETNKKIHFSDEDSNLQKEKQLHDMKERRATFVRYAQNPRMVVKFYKAFTRNVYRCHKQLLRNEEENRIVHKYVRERNIGQIVAFLSFVEAFMPDELQQIIKYGADYIERPFYREKYPVSEGRELLTEIASVTVYAQDEVEQRYSDYIKTEMYRFINKFLIPSAELHQLIKPFTTQEEEWVDAIEFENTEIIDRYWNEMMKMVLEKENNARFGETNMSKKDMFVRLLEYAGGKINWERWKIDKVFSIFETDNKGRLFANGIGLLQAFEDFLRNLKNTDAPTEKSVDAMLNFAMYYSYQRVNSTYQLFRCIYRDEDISKVENIKEEMLDSTRTLEANIFQFVNRIAVCLPELCFEKENWLERYQILSEYISNYLEKQGLLLYEDVKEEVKHMMDTVNELNYLSQILVWISGGDSNVNGEELNERNYSEIEQTINNLGVLLENSEEYLGKDVEKHFSEFFMHLKNSRDIKLSDKQIEQLHSLVTILVERTRCYSLFYRKILLQISLRESEQRIDGKRNVED